MSIVSISFRGGIVKSAEKDWTVCVVRNAYGVQRSPLNALNVIHMTLNAQPIPHSMLYTLCSILPHYYVQFIILKTVRTVLFVVTAKILVPVLLQEVGLPTAEYPVPVLSDGEYEKV